MKIFISHSVEDKPDCIKLVNTLREQGHTVYNWTEDFTLGMNILEQVKKALNESDMLIAIITENFLNSPWAQAELSSVIFGANNMRILPIVVGDNVFVPSYMNALQYVKAETNEDITTVALKKIAKLNNIDDTSTLSKNENNTHEDNIIEEKVNLLKKALIDNKLTLVCGAGVSVDSSIPAWNKLLVSILNDAYSNNQKSNISNSTVNAKKLLSLMPQSTLILGKYLKLILKDDFDKVVQKHLYLRYDERKDLEPITLLPNGELVDYALETNMMKSIVELSRPRRTGNRLESIITFNFDDLIERALSKNSIEHCSIWKEGQTYELNALPIFHVHGFLPNQKDIDDPNLVFSEEAYHSQFIDPYSWANLVQLNTFSTNVCLFVGLSLSDPNLRRLLDISWRRNQRCKHFIIMKKMPQKSRTDEIATMLFEQDANSLGLNVIWCNEFSEIPNILLSIAK